MDTIVIKDIPFEVDTDFMLKSLRLEGKEKLADEFRRLADEARSIGRPKAAFKRSRIESKGDRFVVIGGRKFVSNVLRVNLNDAETVYPTLATCGAELDEWSKGIDNTLRAFWADAIQQMALAVAVNAADRRLKEHFDPGQTSLMTPGSLNDWPIFEQKQLFHVLGDVAEEIGVELTESYFMLPLKSVSGIAFESEEQFQSCQLCPKEKCPNRRAPYDEHLFENKYQIRECIDSA
ncbi:MAG: vitamin B12 dependent methionine synthase [Proteobacteria bacterium]|nr:vitamin B12 dependent methionine synthase [Pseudomonadota bacterium]